MFGGQYDLFPLEAIVEPNSDDPLGSADCWFRDRVHRIHFSGVDKIHTFFERPVDLFVRLVGLGLRTPGHGPKAKFAYHNIRTAQSLFAHHFSLSADTVRQSKQTATQTRQERRTIRNPVLLAWNSALNSFKTINSAVWVSKMVITHS